MCMFSALPPAVTISFLTAVTLIFFSFPLIDRIRRYKSPLIIHLIRRIQTAENAKSEIGISLHNKSSAPITIERIGYIPTLAAEWDSSTYHENSTVWIDLTSTPLNLLPSETKNLQLEIQETLSSPPPLDQVWLFIIDGKKYYRVITQQDIIIQF